MKSWTRNTCRPACMISEKAAAWGWAFQNRGNHLAAQTSTHLYLWPSDPLRPFVAHYTFCLGSGFASAAQEFSPLTILPDASGCLTFTLRGDGLDGAFGLGGLLQAPLGGGALGGLGFIGALGQGRAAGVGRAVGGVAAVRGNGV